MGKTPTGCSLFRRSDRSPARAQISEAKHMTITKLLALSLATALSSTNPQRQIDFSMPGLDTQRINQLWVVTYVNEKGLESSLRQNCKAATMGH
jgi:hypothetical protein